MNETLTPIIGIRVAAHLGLLILGTIILLAVESTPLYFR